MRDSTHDIVRFALEKAGWTITHDPYSITLREAIADTTMQIDLGAERLLAAEREQEKIAVEVKTFLSDSPISAFHTALGQILDYQIGLEHFEPERILYLAVPTYIFDTFFQTLVPRTAIQRYQLKVIVYHPDLEEIVQWIP